MNYRFVRSDIYGFHVFIHENHWEFKIRVIRTWLEWFGYCLTASLFAEKLTVDFVTGYKLFCTADAVFLSNLCFEIVS